MRVKSDDNLLVRNSRESCLIGPAGSLHQQPSAAFSGANIGLNDPSGAFIVCNSPAVGRIVIIVWCKCNEVKSDEINYPV